MAERRMFAKTIIDSDAFLDMPLSAQALYFHIVMRAKSKGVLNNIFAIARGINATKDDIGILLDKGFIKYNVDEDNFQIVHFDRFDIDNGITSCKKCHSEYYRKEKNN